MKEPLQFYLITDLHYFENSLGAAGEAYEARSRTDQKCIAETGAIIDSAFARIAADTRTEIVLIAGDMTFNGEAESHKGMIKKLEALKAGGKRIYMITGNHDGSNDPYAFSGKERIPVEETRREDLAALYYAYGMRDAIAVDARRVCYVAQLGDGVRLLGINYNLGPENSGLEDSMDWIAAQIEDARRSGNLIFGMIHVPILPGSPILAQVGDATVRDWKGIATKLADAGLPLMFSGHMHMQSVNRLVTPAGNFIFDICTGSLVGGPCAIRKVVIDENRVMRVTTSTVPDFDWDKNGMTAEEYFIWRFNRKIEHEIVSRLRGKLVPHIVRGATLATLSKLLFFRADPSLKNKKFLEAAVELSRNVFYGDQPYTEGTPEHTYIMKMLGRLKPAVWIAEKWLSPGNEYFKDIPALVASLIGKERKIDNHAVIDLQRGTVMPL